mgnify:CR=1 FL=1
MKMCGGGKTMKYATGGRMQSKGEHSVQKQSKRGAMAVKMARGATKPADDDEDDDGTYFSVVL